MSFASPRRHRSSRGTSLSLPPNLFARAYETVRRPDVLFRVAAFIFAVLILWLVTGAGTPPFAYRRGDVPRRKIIARVDFQREDEAETEKRRQEARLTTEAVYENNPRLLEEKRQELTNKVGRLQAESFDAVQANPELKAIWLELSPPLMSRPEDAERQRYEALRTYFTAGMDNNRFDEAISQQTQRKAKRPDVFCLWNSLLNFLVGKSSVGTNSAIIHQRPARDHFGSARDWDFRTMEMSIWPLMANA
jgi:membrane-associated HD superfamily phosphohydrolase